MFQMELLLISAIVNAIRRSGFLLYVLKGRGKSIMYLT